jgi:hypothetical protein
MVSIVGLMMERPTERYFMVPIMGMFPEELMKCPTERYFVIPIMGMFPEELMKRPTERYFVVPITGMFPEELMKLLTVEFADITIWEEGVEIFEECIENLERKKFKEFLGMNVLH